MAPSLPRPLAEGLRNRVVCRDDSAVHLMPQPLLRTRETIRLALTDERRHEVKTFWSDAGPVAGGLSLGGCLVMSRPARAAGVEIVERHYRDALDLATELARHPAARDHVLTCRVRAP